MTEEQEALNRLCEELDKIAERLLDIEASILANGGIADEVACAYYNVREAQKMNYTKEDEEHGE